MWDVSITECSLFHLAPLHLAPVGAKAVDLNFDGGRLSSDAGLVLLQDPDEQLGLTRALAAGLKDPRDPRRVDFTLHDLLKQRVLQITAGYEDANDANALRHDPIFKLLLDRLPETGAPLAQPFQYVPVSCATLSSRLRDPLYLAGR